MNRITEFLIDDAIETLQDALKETEKTSTEVLEELRKERPNHVDDLGSVYAYRYGRLIESVKYALRDIKKAKGVEENVGN